MESSDSLARLPRRSACVPYGWLARDLTNARSRSINGRTAFQLVVGTDSTVTVSE